MPTLAKRISISHDHEDMVSYKLELTDPDGNVHVRVGTVSPLGATIYSETLNGVVTHSTNDPFQVIRLKSDMMAEAMEVFV
jgi:hypothetical protein